MEMNKNEGGSAYPPNPDVKSGSCLIAGFQPLTVFCPSYWNAYKTESGATFSIDMVRLKLSFINGKGEWLSTHAQTFDCDSMSAWTSKIRPGGWYELWSFDPSLPRLGAGKLRGALSAAQSSIQSLLDAQEQREQLERQLRSLETASGR